MSWAASQSIPTLLPGELRWVDASDLDGHLATAERENLLPVVVPPPAAAQRGRLGLVIEERIEALLNQRGACPPGVGASSSLDESLSDQLYRARLLELRGMAVALPSLSALVDLQGALDPDDSAVLRFLLGAPHSRPLRLMIDRENQSLRVYDAPRPLHEFVARSAWVVNTELSPPIAPSVAQAAAVMVLAESTPELFDPAPEVAEQDGALSFVSRDVSEALSATPPAVVELPSNSDSAALEETHSDDFERSESESPKSELPDSELPGQVPDSEALTARTPAYGAKPQGVPEAVLEQAAVGSEPSLPEPVTASPPLVDLARSQTAARMFSGKGVQRNPKSPTARALGEALAELAEQAREESPAIGAESPSTLGDIADEVIRSLTVQDEPAASSRSPSQSDDSSGLAALVTEAATDGPARDQPEIPAARAPELPPLYPNAPSEWRNWLRDLEAARGPKPLSAIERMFITSYLPLSYACVHGYADPAAERALENWCQSFAQSYSEAFDALRVRGKRPSMVLDAPELALRIGRLHGARSVQLLLVDGMRFDLGLLVEQRVRLALGQDAALTERLLLWAALPTTSEVQLDLLGRGPEALKEGRTSGGSDVTVARGRAAATLRRVKTHNRELLKLDLVEARLAEPGPREAQRLTSLADETAAILVEHISKQAPRTLVFAFGDHGFRLDPLEKGTRAARSGGATPEEVLVPAFAWLVGGVH